MASGIENSSTFTPRAHLRIVVTGATGFVGRLLVPRLQSAGAQLLLVGRDPAKLTQLFPECINCDYTELSTRGADFDMLLHLATLNNNQNCSRETFRQVNVDFLLQTARAAKQARIPTFVDISSIQTLDLVDGKSLYADTKREGSALLRKMDGIEIRTIFLPLVHANHTYSGKLSGLNRMPGWLSQLLFAFLSALKPTLHADQLTNHILAGASGGVVTTGQSKNTAYRMLSRAIDLSFAVSVLVVLWWLILIA
jgi:nucleoside-diphosphate-sugar epimerase